MENCCTLILENAEGKFLLQLRENKTKINYPGQWATFGGHIEKNETPKQALVREIEEELEYDCSDSNYCGTHETKNEIIHIFRKKTTK